MGVWNHKIDPKIYLNRLCYASKSYDKNEQKRSFGLNATRGQLRGDHRRYSKKYCERCKPGDIIAMCLDLNKMELGFKINDNYAKHLIMIMVNGEHVFVYKVN